MLKKTASLGYINSVTFTLRITDSRFRDIIRMLYCPIWK